VPKESESSRTTDATFHTSCGDVAEYYNSHQSSYSRFWSRTALHYGFWYDDTRNLAEAIINTDRFVIEVLAINSDDVVLDAGCGVGGSSIYIAETTGARLHGITVSEIQLKIAQRRAANSSLANRLSFSQQDYTCTNYTEGTFSKVFGIESVCYAKDKLDFLTEAYRIMQPGGRIAVLDAFLTKDELDPTEQGIYTKFTTGWVVPNLSSRAHFHSLLMQAGYTNIMFHDMHRYVQKSVRRIHRFSLLTSPVNFVASKLGLARENLAALYQKALFERKIAIYGVFVAEKPDERVM
jgi:tocopherol O-methyltransferase